MTLIEILALALALARWHWHNGRDVSLIVGMCVEAQTGGMVGIGGGQQQIGASFRVRSTFTLGPLRRSTSDGQ
jgi:hypothetical protein